MKMNLHQFKLLNRQAQAAIIDLKGVFQSTIEISEYTVDLYQVDNFLVKVFHNKINDEITFRSYYSVNTNSFTANEVYGKYFNETLIKIAYL